MEWFGSLATTVLNTMDTILVDKVCTNPVYFWREEHSGHHMYDKSNILVALHFVRTIRTIAPEDVMSLSVMFSTMQTPPTKRSLRTVLSYSGGTSTTLFLPCIFANNVTRARVYRVT